MRKILYSFLIVLLVVISSVLIYSYVSFNMVTVDDSEFKSYKISYSYFKESYIDARKDFRTFSKLLQSKYKNVESITIPVKSKVDDDLTIDCTYLPAQKRSDKLLILVSGIHGIEGYVGSAIQKMFIKEIIKPYTVENMGVVLIHGMNPYGFKYFRRVTENNVDLNRNSDVDKKLFSTKNKGYVKITKFLNPTGKIDLGTIENKFFVIKAVKKILSASMSTLRQAILQGQYTIEKGIYFGGKDFEPQILQIKSYLKNKLLNYKSALAIDLHTGYGKRGYSHLFPNPIKDKKLKSAVESVFKGYDIDWGDSGDFYIISGSFVDFIAKISPEKKILPMLIECGTLNSQTTIGSIKSIHNTIIENQGFYYGYATKEDERILKKRYLEMFFPSSKGWRSEIIRKHKEILNSAVDNYLKLNL